MRNYKSSRFLLWVLGSIAFLSLPLLFSHADSFAEAIGNERTQKELPAYVFILISYFVNTFYLIPRFHQKRKFGLYAALITILLVVVSLGPELILKDEHEHHEHHEKTELTTGGANVQDRGSVERSEHGRHDGFRPPPFPDFFIMSHHAFVYLVLVFYSLMMAINSQWKRAQREKLSAELSFLKAQIHPHFLFNTLNGIYSLAMDKSDDTAPAIVKLSGMMRYVMSETGSDFVSLEKELEYIDNFIDLQKIRFGDTVTIHYGHTGNPAGKKIAPLLLIPFIENAFKHGINPEENSELNIALKISDDHLYLKVTNNIVKYFEDPKISLGIGEENVTRRLQLLYPGKHHLDIREDENTYTVELTLTLL